MFKIHNLFKSTFTALQETCEQHPVAAAVTTACAAAAICASACYFHSKSHPPRPNTLIDGYELASRHRPKIVLDPARTSEGISLMQKVLLEAHNKKKRSEKLPKTTLIDGYELPSIHAPTIVLNPDRVVGGISLMRSVLLEAHSKKAKYQQIPELVVKLGQPHKKSQSDLASIQKIASDIKKANVTISDGCDYSFVKTHRTFIEPSKTTNGNIALLAMAMKAHNQKKSFHDSPELIVELGDRCLKDGSGVCDHMSAAFIAKVVEHIRNGGEWNSAIELVGNKHHSFAVVGRENVAIDCLKHWGNRAITVDPWLGCLGIKDEWADRLKEEDGVFLGSAVLTHARLFGRENGRRLKVLHRFSVEELRQLARDPSLAKA